jgi:protease-4
MSPETKEVMNSLVDDLYGDLLDAIAKGRGKDAAAVRAIIDTGPFLAKQAKANGLIDDLRYEDEVFGEMKTDAPSDGAEEGFGKGICARHGCVAGSGRDRQYADRVRGGRRHDHARRRFRFRRPGIGRFRPHAGTVGNDTSVKAAIIRINSPGGEVVASDDMWRAMNQLKAKKPMVISMADEAASGGYYMAMTGSPIVAYPGTITGSIGVVFGKPNLHGLYDKLGITKDTVSRGKFALIDSDYSSLTPEERPS